MRAEFRKSYVRNGKRVCVFRNLINSSRFHMCYVSEDEAIPAIGDIVELRQIGSRWTYLLEADQPIILEAR